MALLNLPVVLIPKAPNPQRAKPEEFFTWAAGVTQVLDHLKTFLEGAIEAFVGSSAQMGTDVITADTIQANTINAYHLITTSALITTVAQIQDAIITNAKIVSLESQRIYMSGNTAQTLTTAGSTLILPGLLQISGGGSAQKAIKVKGTASGTRDTGNRSLLIDGVEQYTSTALAAANIGWTIAQINTAGTLVAGSMKTYETFSATADQDALAAEIRAVPVSNLIVLSSHRALGSACLSPGTDLRDALATIGADVNSLEGIMTTGSNPAGGSKIPTVIMGFRGNAANAGITVFTNGSTDAGAAEYQGFLTGNQPAIAASPQWGNTTVIEGGSIRTGTVTADRLDVTQLSAITGNMGTLNAGTINGGRIISGATSSAHTVMSPSGVQVYNATGEVAASLNTGTNTLSLTSAGGTLNLAPGADIKMNALSGDPAEIIWFHSSGTQIAKVTVESSPKLIGFNPTTDGTGTLQLGKPGAAWNGINFRSDTAMTLNAGGNQITYDSGKFQVNVGGASRAFIYDTASFRAAVDGQQTLGDAANSRWLGLFLNSGGINFTTAGASTATLSVGDLSLPTAGAGVFLCSLAGTVVKIPYYF